MTALLVMLSLAGAPDGGFFVIDTHADTTQYLLDYRVDFVTPSRADMHLDLPKARAGGLAAEFFSIWVDFELYKGTYAHRSLAQIDVVLEQVRAHPNELQLALTADDVLAARKAGRFAVLMGVEGGHAIENDLGMLRTFYRLGVR